MKKIALTLIVLLCSGISFADTVANNNGQSRENSKFESEGDLVLDFPDLLKIIKQITPGDGRVRIEYETLTGFANDKNNRHSINIAMETYLFGLHAVTHQDLGHHGYDNSKPTGVEVGIIPVEFRMAFNASDVNDMSVRDIRAGAVRFILKDSPATVQVASYVLKTYPHMYGRFHGAELVGLTLKTATSLNKSGSVQIVIKGEIALQLGATTGRTSLMNKALEEAGRSTENSKYVPFTLRTPISGSIGVRIEKNLLIDAFGGADLNGNWASHYEYEYVKKSTGTPGSSLDISATSHMAHVFGGAGVRFHVRGFVVSGTVQKDWYFNTFKYDHRFDTVSAVPAADGDGYDTGEHTTIESYKGSHNNSDSGYTGMISVGYDW